MSPTALPCCPSGISCTHWCFKCNLLLFTVNCLQSNGYCTGLMALQAWQALHIPVRGGIFTKPKVHAGFQRSYRAKGFSAQMLERVGDILAKSGRAGQQVSILVTGQAPSYSPCDCKAYKIMGSGFRVFHAPPQHACCWPLHHLPSI